MGRLTCRRHVCGKCGLESSQCAGDSEKRADRGFAKAFLVCPGLAPARQMSNSGRRHNPSAAYSGSVHGEALGNAPQTEQIRRDPCMKPSGQIRRLGAWKIGGAALWGGLALGLVVGIGAVSVAGHLATAGPWSWLVEHLTGRSNTFNVSSPTVVEKIRQLSRLETVEYSLDKIVEGDRQSPVLPDFLAGDKLLLVAHGEVIAGIDLGQLKASDVVVSGESVRMRLPAAQILYDAHRQRAHARLLEIDGAAGAGGPESGVTGTAVSGAANYAGGAGRRHLEQGPSKRMRQHYHFAVWAGVPPGRRAITSSTAFRGGRRGWNPFELRVPSAPPPTMRTEPQIHEENYAAFRRSHPADELH